MNEERWSFAAGYLPDDWGVVALVVCAAVAAIEGVWAFRRPRATIARRMALTILGLRFIAIAALFAVAFELTLRVEEVAPAGRRLVVLVDTSASMALADANTLDDPPQTRQARAEAIWAASESARAAWREEGLIVEVRGFDLETTPYSGELAKTLATNPTGAASDLAKALTELGEPGPGGRQAAAAPLSGIVVISDGLVAGDPAADRHVRAVAESLGLPITTVATGAPAIRDVSVAAVRAGEFAFVENVTEIEATVVAHGLKDRPTRVELRRNGEVVSKQRLRLPADGVPQTLRFEVAPDRVGQFVYEIAVPPQDGEATTANNRRAFVVKVLRDKVRVLHVAGRPDWDVRALRTLLRRDPNVELLSYYILRGFDDIAREDTTAPLSLIPFPTEELFEEQLGSFDLVILHNFDAVQHQVAQYVDNMAQYVVEGGALVLIGGDLGLSDGGYGAPAMASLLPVDTRRPSRLEHARFSPELTEPGRRHPITAWLKADGGSGWDTLPQLETFNPLAMTRRSATISASALLVHPTQRDRQGNPRPLLAVAEPGRGRTMVLATGSTWRLGFAPDLPLIDGARPYDLLWLGAVRWLLRDDTSGRLTLETDRPRYRVGDTVELRAKTLSASYAPEPDVDVAWELVSLDASAPRGRASEALVSGTWRTDGLGRAREELADLPVGSYVAVARRSSAASEGGEDDAASSTHEVRRVFIVEPPGRELAKVDADPGTARLANLAEQTGGEALVAADGDPLPRRLPIGDPFAGRGDDQISAAHGARSDFPLWNGWASMLVLIAAFGGEWLLRRRSGER